VFTGSVTAQQLACDKLQQIVNVAAADSAFKSLRGAEKENKFSKSKEYEGTAMLWQPDGYIVQGQYIEYDGEEHHYIYHAIYGDGSTGEAEKEGTKKIVKMLSDCLGSGWLLKTDTEVILGESRTVYYLKNTSNYVVVKILNLIDTDIECYNDSKNSTPQCIAGDCSNNFGSIHFFTEDTYSGTFIDGTLSGVGNLNWHSTKMTYQGSFIDNQLAGYGGLYDENNRLVKKGFFFKGDTVSVNRYKDGCQFGDCQNGFGLKMNFNAIYVGNFKDGYPDGLGETIFGNGDDEFVHFGYYKMDHENDKGIFVESKGKYTFWHDIAGKPKGEYEVDYIDKTSLQFSGNDNLSSYFDEDNILTKSGTMVNNVFTEKNDPVYLNLKAAAKSLKEFYSYRQTGYKEIRGEQGKLLKTLGMEGGYQSSLLFQKIYKTSIDVDHNRYYFVTVSLSGNSADKTKWTGLYNKYYDIINNALGNRWRAVTDEGKAGIKKNKGFLALQNIFDKSKIVNLSLDEKGVQMEIH
jgi:hypothetical protein